MRRSDNGMAFLSAKAIVGLAGYLCALVFSMSTLASLSPASLTPQLQLSPQEIAWLKQHPVIRLGVDPGYAPYAFFDESGQYQGVSADFVSLIGEMLGVRMVPVPGLSWPEIIQGVKDRKVDVITTATHLPEREAFLHFSTSYIFTPLVVMTSKENVSISSTKDLAHHTVALVRGYASTTRVLKEHAYMPIKLKLVDSPLAGLLAVASGKADAYVGVLGVNTYLANKHGLSNLKIAAQYDLTGNSQRFGVRKDWPELARLLDKALQAIPEYQKQAILQKWVPVDTASLTQQGVTLSPAEKQWLARFPRVRIAVSSLDEPFEYRDKTGRFAGLVSDYLDYIQRHTGLVIEPLFVPDRARRLAMVEQGEVAAAVAMSAPPERWPRLKFTYPFYISDLIILNRKSDGFVADIGDLSGKIVAVKAAGIAEEVLAGYPLIQPRLVESTQELFSAIDKGDADAAIAEVSAAAYMLGKLNLSNVRYSSPIQSQRIALRFAVNKTQPELLSIIDKALSIMPNEQSAAIRRLWLGNSITKGIDPVVLGRWLAATAGAILLIMGLFYAWNRRLSSRVAERTASLSQAVSALQQEVAAREAAQIALRQEKELAHITLASIGDAVITTHRDGKVAFMNHVAEKLTEWSIADALGQPLDQVFQVVDERSREPFTDWLALCRDDRCNLSRDKHGLLISRTGRECAIEQSVSPIQTEKGEALGVVLVFQDVSQTRAMTAKLNYQAQHDGLTGLMNRQAFEHVLANALNCAKHEGVSHALLYLDLDQFKVVNDTCGHQAGDELLQQIAALMHEPLREQDTLARLGGDEFGVLLQHCPLEHARVIGDRIRQIIEAHRFHWNKRVFRLGMSIGVVPVEPTSPSVIALLSAADMACFAAKDSGRNRVHVVQLDDQEIRRRSHEMEWLPRLEQALEDNRFQLYFQRISPIQRQSDAPHFEILLRLMDEERQLIMPGTFIPAAERYGLMSKVDRWVIEHVFASKSVWNGRANTLCAINLSGQSLNAPDLIGRIRDLEKRYDINPRQICFEITETTAIAHLGNAGQLIGELTDVGYQFALDDFGSGLSSFPYLQNLPVDYLKIDGAFVIDMAENLVNYTLVESIVRIGKVMGMQTIAEFVQNQATLAALCEIGVDYAQGYFLHKPEHIEVLSAQKCA